MINIRYGKNISFVWVITLNGQAIDLSQHRVDVEITLPNNNKTYIKPEVDYNVLTFEYQGHNIGKHWLTCYLDKNTKNELMCDEKYPFNLVNKSWQEDDSLAGDVQTESINLSWNINNDVATKGWVKAQHYIRKDDLGDDIVTKDQLDDALETKQDTLTAGENITIDENNVISAVGGGSTYTAGNGIDITGDTISVDTNVVATQNDLSEKQDTLTAGSNITIANNVISATDTTYTAGAGIDITNDVISVDANVVAIKSDLDDKQDTLTAGSNINIDANNVISAAYSAGAGIDITNDVISVDTDVVATQSDLDDKQDTLTAGNHIEITNNVIDTKGLVDMQEFDDALLGKQDTLTAGTNITIDANNVISASGSSYTAGNGIDITNDIISLEHNIVPLTQAQYDALVTSGQLDPDAIYFVHPEAPSYNVETATDSSTGTALDMWTSEETTIDGNTVTLWHQTALNTYGYGSTYRVNDQKCYIHFKNLPLLILKVRLDPVADTGLTYYNYPYYSHLDTNINTGTTSYGDSDPNNKWCGYGYNTSDWYTLTYDGMELNDQWHTIEISHHLTLNGQEAYFSYTNDQFYIDSTTMDASYYTFDLNSEWEDETTTAKAAHTDWNVPYNIPIYASFAHTGQDNSHDTMYIRFKNMSKLVLHVTAVGEIQADDLQVNNVDKPWTSQGQNMKMIVQSSGVWETVTFDNLPCDNTEHYIALTYYKDGSVAQSDDKGYLYMLPTEQEKY